MAADGQILHKSSDFLAGAFLELNAVETPITSMAGGNGGFKIKPQKNYTMTYHSDPAQTTSNNKPDNSSPTYGSTPFTSGSQCMQIYDEGANVTFAGMGDQDLSRTLGWQDQNNISNQKVISDLARGKADALKRIKGYVEYQALYGTYSNPAEGTTAHYSQRGLLNDPDLVIGTANGAVIAAGTLGTLGTLTNQKIWDQLSTMYNNKLWGSEPLVACGGAQSIIALNNMFMSEYNFGNNGEDVEISGVKMKAFNTPLGDVFLKLTKDPANASHLWFLNPTKLEMVARPVPGMGVLFERDTSVSDKSQVAQSIYGEIGLNYVHGLAHSVIKGVGTAIIGGQNLS